MKKRSIVTTISAVLLALTTGALAGCNPATSESPESPTTSETESESQQQGVTLVDFGDVAETVELGSTYALTNVATDTDGNDYQVTYRCVDAEGQSVALNKYTFVATKVGVFTITGTVTLSDGTTKSRTITLTVTDTVTPTVTIGRTKVGYVGVAYKLPEITAEDASGDVNLDVKVVLTGDTETEMEVVDGFFTPTAAGDYQIRATATDASGNKGSATASFIVKLEKDPAAPTEVLDFADEDASSMRKGLRDTPYTFEILDEYEDAQGVMKVTTEDECIKLVIAQMAHPKAHYAEYDNVVVRMYIPSDKRVHHLTMNDETSNAKYYDLDGGANEIKYDQWFDYRFEASCLLVEAENLPDIFLYTYERKMGSLYIDDISVEKVCKVNIADAANGTVGEEYTLPTYTYENFGETVTTTEKLYLLGEERTEIAFENGKFTPETAGQYLYELTVSDGVNSLTKSVEFTVTAFVDNPRVDELVDFDEKSDVNHVTDGGRPEGRNEFSWVDSFQGETGVLKVHTMDDQPWISFGALAHEKEYYRNFELVTFKMWLTHKGSGDYHHMWFGNEVAPMYYFNGSQAGAFTYDAWTEYTFPIERLYDQENPRLAFYTETYGEWADIYIADIKVTMKPDVAREDEVIDFNEPVDLEKVTYGDRPADRAHAPELLASHEGETGVLKVNTMDDNPRIRITEYANEFSSYSSYDLLTIRMWLTHKGPNDYHHIYINWENGPDMYYFEGAQGCAGYIQYEQWVDYTFPISYLTEGGFELRLYNDNYDHWGNIYISDIFVQKQVVVEEVRDDEVIDFDEANDLEKVTYGDRPADRAEAPVLLDSYEGETGVLKVRTMDDNPRIRITEYAHDFAHYASYTKLIVRMWLGHKGPNDLHHIYINWENGPDMYYFNGGGAGPITYEQWVDYEFSASGYLTEGGFELRIYNDNYNHWGDIYISDIRVA